MGPALVRGMTARDLDTYFASTDVMVPLVGTLADESVDSDVLFGLFDETFTNVRQHVMMIQPLFTEATPDVDMYPLAVELRKKVEDEKRLQWLQFATVQLQLLRSELAQLEYAEHTARALVCTQLVDH